MPTVSDILKQSGFSDDQIAAMDNRAITAFSGVLSQAEQEHQAAELAKRANADFYDQQIVPALTGWDEEKQRIENEKARVAAEAAFYRTQAEEAKKFGFVPADAPSFQGRDQQGRYVAGAPGATPGSPQFFDVNRVYERAGDAVSVIADIQWEHQQLFGSPLPVSPSELIRQADAMKLDPKTYAARKFDFAGKRQEQEKRRQEAHDAEIAAKATAENDRKWAERVGSNPDVRMPLTNPKYTEIARAVKAGTRPDPLMMNESQRRAETRTAIRTELAEQ
jgi:hypothetical protein